MASKNESIVDDWLQDDNLMLLEAWARDGYTYQDIAERIGIADSTLKTWRKKYPEIDKALRTGREIIDYKVENALLKAALGYQTSEVKITVGKITKNGVLLNLMKETTIKEVAPNVTACAIWLNNRLPDKWKKNRDKVLEFEDEDNNLCINIIRGKSEDNDSEESVNREITITKKTNKKEATIKEQEEDPDYWPDDWEDDDE